MATPVVVVSAGTQITTPIRISSIVWSAGGRTAGDLCVIKFIGGEDIWEGRALGSQVYQGINFSADDPVAAPGGIEVSTLAGGRVFIYKES